MFNFFFQQAACNFVFRCTIAFVAEIFRLYELVHNTPLRYVKMKKIVFIYFACIDEPVVFKDHAVQREVFADRASVNPSVGEDEIIFCHKTRAFKGFFAA